MFAYYISRVNIIAVEFVSKTSKVIKSVYRKLFLTPALDQCTFSFLSGGG